MTPAPELVAALTQSVLPRGICVAARDPTVPSGPHDPAEAAAIAGAVPARVMEFHAGRAAARAAMAALGVPNAPVGMAADRAPVWPAGVTGSISHSATACVAAVGRPENWAGIGVDLEEATALAADLIPEICTSAERAWLGAQPADARGLMAKLVFSAKEAVYKAQYPVTGQVFGFDALEIAIDRDESRFSARFTVAQGRFAVGSIIAGSYAHAAGLLVTGCAVGHSGLGHRADG